MKRVGLKETRFFHTPRTQAAIVTTASRVENPFAVLVYRGTSGRITNWYYNFQAGLSEWPKGGRVHAGFKKLFMETWDAIESVLGSTTVPVFFTGHSLGAALATLAATLRTPAGLYTFGSPRVGDADFSALLDQVPAFRIAANRDIVTTLPPVGFSFPYRHTGRTMDLAGNSKERFRKQTESGESFRLKWDGLLNDPPDFLFDHAPINLDAKKIV